MFELNENNLVKRLETDKFHEEKKVKEILSKVALKHRVGISVTIEDVKISGGFFGNKVKAVLVRNAKHPKDYYIEALYQKVVSGHSFIYIHQIGMSKNIRNKIMHEDMVKNATSFTQKMLANASKPKFEAMEEENLYYDDLIKIFQETFDELANEPITIPNVDSSMVDKEVNHFLNSNSAQNIESNIEHSNEICNEEIENDGNNQTESNSLDEFGSSVPLEYVPPKANTNSDENLSTDIIKKDNDSNNEEENYTGKAIKFYLYIFAGVFGYHFTVIGGIKGAIIGCVILAILASVPKIVQYIIVAIIGAALGGIWGILGACGIWFIVRTCDELYKVF